MGSPRTDTEKFILPSELSNQAQHFSTFLLGLWKSVTLRRSWIGVGIQSNLGFWRVWKRSTVQKYLVHCDGSKTKDLKWDSFSCIFQWNTRFFQWTAWRRSSALLEPDFESHPVWLHPASSIGIWTSHRYLTVITKEKENRALLPNAISVHFPLLFLSKAKQCDWVSVVIVSHVPINLILPCWWRYQSRTALWAIEPLPCVSFRVDSILLRFSRVKRSNLWQTPSACLCPSKTCARYVLWPGREGVDVDVGIYVNAIGELNEMNMVKTHLVLPLPLKEQSDTDSHHALNFGFSVMYHLKLSVHILFETSNAIVPWSCNHCRANKLRSTVSWQNEPLTFMVFDHESFSNSPIHRCYQPGHWCVQNILWGGIEFPCQHGSRFYCSRC